MNTALYDRHVKLKAKIVDFSGWQMPLQYEGIVKEHLAVRNDMGMFDVSHMGRISITGNDAEKFLSYLSTNTIKDKSDLTATYTLFCHQNGTIVDDVIIYKINNKNFFIIANASNREKDLNHLEKMSKGYDVQIKPLFDQCILAVQGPKVKSLFEKIFSHSSSILPMRFSFFSFLGEEIIIAATGYTGAGGYEVMGSEKSIVALFDKLLDQKVTPVGLGARDTLRLEKGYALYGHELSDEILATESVSKWTIKGSHSFFGKEALDRAKKLRHTYGIVLQGLGIAREGFAVHNHEKMIGKITSGTFSPSLNKAIALMLVDQELKIGDKIQVEIRKNKVEAEVVSLPFL